MTRPDQIATTCSLSHKIFKITCKGCNHIKNIWYNFAKASGFEDIEEKCKYLDPWHDIKRKKDFQNEETFQAVIDYYSWCNKASQSFEFKNAKDEVIWRCHAEGMTRRRISQVVGLEHSWITRKIHKIERYLICQERLLN